MGLFLNTTTFCYYYKPPLLLPPPPPHQRRRCVMISECVCKEGTRSYVEQVCSECGACGALPSLSRYCKFRRTNTPRHHLAIAFLIYHARPSPRHDASPHATLNSPLRILFSFRIHFRNKLSLPCCNENFQTELCRSVHGVVSFATSMLLETQFLTTRKLYLHAHFLSISSCSLSFYSSSSSALGPKVKFCTAAKGLQTVNSAPSVLPSRHACDPRFSPFSLSSCRSSKTKTVQLTRR